MTTDGETTSRPVLALGQEGDGASGGRETAERETQLRLALEATGLALWTWDAVADLVRWSPGPTWLTTAAGHSDVSRQARDLIARFVHPNDLAPLQRTLTAAVSQGSPLDVEFRVILPDGTMRWMLARGAASELPGQEPGQPARRLTGILLDITERALARSEHYRLLQAERRASRRAGALQRLAAALSEAATTEEVAAVMVEESLRSLGAGAAQVRVHRSGRSAGNIGGSGHRDGDLVRSAGSAHLLEGTSSTGDGFRTQPRIDVRDGCTRVMLALNDRRRHRGHWTVAWRDAEATEDGLRPPQPWSPVEWTSPEGLGLLHTLAVECGQAIDRAELYEQQRGIATVLQHTLLPSVLPEVEGATIAARYQPGGQGVDVGGDWYDVITLPDGRSGLVIGDVEGHSATAAAVMGQVRNALRAYAAEGSTPATVMERVNRLLARLQVTQLVSCCYLEFAPSTGTATVVLAGHPPPLLLAPGRGWDFVPAPANVMLGVDASTRYVETTVLLDPGACLLLYTDGLVESVDRSLPAGLSALRSWAADRDVDSTPDDLVEGLVRLAHEGHPVLDDVAMLALAYHPRGRPERQGDRTVRRTFPLDPTSASAARRFVSDVLAQWGLVPLIHQVTLMASELVTNSVLHTSGELELVMTVDAATLRVEVVDRSERIPAVQTPDAEAPGGRGLLIIEALASHWGVDVRDAGKAVWFEVLLDSDAPVP